jgi:hypothetical protein
MKEPAVAAVMLCSPGREAYQSQALSCLERQTYTGDIRLVSRAAVEGVTIGEMRNRANELAAGTDIICHFDDDDWSHPNRIAEQVALLQATGADCVGYNEMLFWDQRPGQRDGMDALNEAWLYSNPNPRYALGTSLCYWRKAWEARPFQDINHGEDTEWIRGLNCYAMSGVQGPETYGKDFTPPRLIARIHAGNSSSAYDPIEMARHNMLPRSERQWSRAFEWDKVCREVME